MSDAEFQAKMKEHEEAMEAQMAQESDRKCFATHTAILATQQTIFSLKFIFDLKISKLRWRSVAYLRQGGQTRKPER